MNKGKNELRLISANQEVVELSCRSAIDLLAHRRSDRSFTIHIDPPYQRAARQAANAFWPFEMTDDQHTAMAGVINNAEVAIACPGTTARNTNAWFTMEACFTGQGQPRRPVQMKATKHRAAPAEPKSGQRR